MHAEYVIDWMSASPIVIAPDTSLTTAQHLMEQHDVRRLPVVQDGKLVGIVTWGDLRAAGPSAATTLSIYEWRALLQQATIAEVMTRDPVTIAPDAPVQEAARLMLERKIGGLPVVSNERVVGIITESDLLRLLIGATEGRCAGADKRATFVCRHCGTVLRRRSFDSLGPDDACWYCHYHLHRCENCRYFDGVGCLLGRAERHTPIPGQHCPVFAALPHPEPDTTVSTSNR